MPPPEPFTLRSAAGLPTEPHPFSSSVLIVIDAQLEYVSGALALPDIGAALVNVARLIESARTTATPVVHVLHQGRQGGLFDPDLGGVAIGSVAPGDGETIVTKTLPNAFAKTSLENTLGALGRRQLIVAGFMTHMCVSSTARAGLDLGYEVVVASDATATRALPSIDDGPAVDATTVHRVALAELADRFCIVSTTDKILASVGDSI